MVHVLITFWRARCVEAQTFRSYQHLHDTYMTLKRRAVNSLRRSPYATLSHALTLWRHAALECRGAREQERLKQWQRALTQEAEERRNLHQTLFLKGYVIQWRQWTLNVRHAREIETLQHTAASTGSLWESNRKMSILAAIEELQRDKLLYESFMR